MYPAYALPAPAVARTNRADRRLLRPHVQRRLTQHVLLQRLALPVRLLRRVHLQKVVIVAHDAVVRLALGPLQIYQQKNARNMGLTRLHLREFLGLPALLATLHL